MTPLVSELTQRTAVAGAAPTEQRLLRRKARAQSLREQGQGERHTRAPPSGHQGATYVHGD